LLFCRNETSSGGGGTVISYIRLSTNVIGGEKDACQGGD
jgi:hypothetical protein